MKILFCWRCQTEMPMLDNEEFAEMRQLFHIAWTTREAGKRPEFQRTLDFYERLTGYCETNPNAIMHHQISQHGPPCRVCGKPLRTARANFCAACGATKE